MTDSSMDDFKIEKVLGKGSFGSVYLVRRKEDNRIYALKSVILEKLNKKEQQNSVNEVRILASVNHPNVIGYKEAFWDDSQNTLNIVMEYADDGDLQTKISKMRKDGGMFREDLIWSYSIQMIEGLKALHDKKIMHRDLKSANIFLVKDKHQCKIGDMNVSKVIKEKELLTQTGTPYYASPEVWRDEPYSYKSDLWSIGCVIYELCALRPPFKGKDLDELFMNVCKGKVERISLTYSDDLWKMILMLLQVDVKKRCDCDQFLNSKLIVRKIQEMKNENKDYKNLEKNKDINDGDLLDTIRFENIFDIKRQLPTKKNYSNNNAVLNSGKNNIKKVNKQKVMISKYNYNNDIKNKNNNITGPSNSIKYHKINYKNKKIIYNNNKNLKTIGKNKIPIKTEIDKDKDKDKEKKSEKIKENDLGKKSIDLESNYKIKKIPYSMPQESENSIANIEQKINSSIKTSITKKINHLKNSPNSKTGKTMIYQKPKLFENSVKKDKKNIYLNNKSMTTKRSAKKVNYIPRNITPKREVNKIQNKTENISSINNKQAYSIRNKNIQKKGYASVNREKAKLISRPIETSPAKNDSININDNNFYLYPNIIKKKNNSKKLYGEISQRPQSSTPIIKNAKILDNENSLLEQNKTEINLNADNILDNVNKINGREFLSNRENMVNMLINNYNKNNINFNSYNFDNKINKNNIIERPLSTTNNNKNYLKRQIYDKQKYEIKNQQKVIKYPYNKIQSRGKQNYNKKIRESKKLIDRDMTQPEIIKKINPIKLNNPKNENQRALNISLNNKEDNNAFLHQKKGNKMIRYNTNNDPRYNQYYSNNSNQNNPQIFNNYVSINNLVTSNFPVKLLNVFNNK